MRELDTTPWPEVQDLLDYWQENPPLHVMVRAYLGIEPPDQEDAVAMTPEQLQSWMATNGGR